MQRTFHLESGESETLKAVPTRKVLSVSTFSKGGSVEKVGNVINLYFEGNWMPIKVCHVLVWVSLSQQYALRLRKRGLLGHDKTAPQSLHGLD